MKRGERTPEKNLFHPSSIGTKCFRKLYYFQTLKTEYDTDTLKIFEVGTVVHDWFLKFLKWATENKKGIRLIRAEMPINIPIDLGEDELWITGYIDHFIEVDGERLIIEVKSTKSLTYINEPSEHHVAQATLYMKGSRTKKALIIYVEKPTFQLKIFEIAFDKILYHKVVKKMAETFNFIKTKNLPPKTESWECKKYCIFKEHCDKNYNPLLTEG